MTSQLESQDAFNLVVDTIIDSFPEENLTAAGAIEKYKNGFSPTDIVRLPEIEEGTDLAVAISALELTVTMLLLFGDEDLVGIQDQIEAAQQARDDRS